MNEITQATELFNEGTRLYESGDFINAEKKLKQALDVFPNSDNVLYNLALTYFELGKINHASKTAKRIKDIDCSELLQLIEKHEKPYNKFCFKCTSFENNIGVCNTLHFNVKEYPKTFWDKCEGKLFKLDPDKETFKIDPELDETTISENNDPSDYIEILNTFNLADIATIKSILIGSDIDFIVRNEYFHLAKPAIQPVRFYVKRDQVEDSKELLNDFEAHFFIADI